MKDTNKRNVVIAVIVVVLILLAIWYVAKRRNALQNATPNQADQTDQVKKNKNKKITQGNNGDAIDQPKVITTLPKGPYTFTKITDVEYAVVNGHSLLLDIYQPQGVSASTPLVIFAHGGGFIAGSKNGGGFGLGDAMASHGFAFASINYDLSNVAIYPAPVVDMKGALRYLRANATKYNINPNKVALTGFSAGGITATNAGVTSGVPELDGTVGGNLDQSNKVQAVVDGFGSIYSTDLAKIGPQDRMEEELGCNILEASCAQILHEALPENYLDAGDPPYLIIHGEKDVTLPVKASVDLAAAMKAAGMKVTLITDPKYGHGADVYFAHINEVFAFLDGIFK